MSQKQPFFGQKMPISPNLHASWYLCEDITSETPLGLNHIPMHRRARICSCSGYNLCAHQPIKTRSSSSSSTRAFLLHHHLLSRSGQIPLTANLENFFSSNNQFRLFLCDYALTVCDGTSSLFFSNWTLDNNSKLRQCTVCDGTCTVCDGTGSNNSC